MRRVVILGGGYAGLHAYTAMRWRLRSEISRGAVDLTLVSRDGYHTYHGWTGEVLAGDLPVGRTLTALEPMLGTSFVQGEAVAVDLAGDALTVKTSEGELRIAFDQLLIAAGSVDPFDRIPGLAEHGWCVKNSRDMQKLVGELEQRDASGQDMRDVVIVGGGLAGVETASALAARFGGTVNVHLVSSSEQLLPSLRPDFNHIADTAERTLAEQGVQIHRGARVARIDADGVELADGRTVTSDLSVVAAGVSYAALKGTESLPRNAAGQIFAGDDLRVRGSQNIWVAGDIAAVQHPGSSQLCPTNALWAMKQGDCAGRNIARSLKGRPAKKFNFRGLGQAAGLAGQRGITELWGLQFTGRLAWVIRVLFFAWFMPSRRGALGVLGQLGGNMWRAATAMVVRPRGRVAKGHERPAVAKLSGPIR